MEPEIETHESQSSSSAQIVASVDDLLIEIFLRVPMKPLLRFKSVSKHWQSLISDPGFSILRNPNPNPATGLIFQVLPTFQGRASAPYAYIVSLDKDSTSPQIRALNLIDPWPYKTTIIRSSCNGLILMCGNYEDLARVKDYYVCNPTTNKYLKLPQIHDKPDWMLPMCLAFDPSKSPHYKVVCAMTLEPYAININWYQFLVYSSETGCWGKSCVEPFEAASVEFKRGVYWNGAMHWVSYNNTGKSLYFDPENDRMSEEIMPTPPNVMQQTRSYYFGETCGHLHYIDECWTWRLNVYELRRDYSEWFVKYRINDDPSVGRNMLYLFAVVRGKSHDDDSFSVLLIGGKFVRYNFLHKTHEIICQLEGSPLEQCFTKVPLFLPLQHAESLCSV